MNYKALATIFLLAVPLMLPIALANQPPPQTWNVEFKIRPEATKFYGPCLVSTMFPIDVFLWNDKALTGVGVYAFDFYVYWNNVGISLDSFVNHIPWASGKYYLIINETGTAFGMDFYHLAVTAIGNSTLEPGLELGATGLFNASLVTLNFHIDSEPFWPNNVHTGFFIGNELGADLTEPEPLDTNPLYDPHVSTGCTVIITNIELALGTFDLFSGRPNIDPEATLAAPYPANITVNSKGVTKSVYIHLTNILGAYGFGFTLTYDPLWKSTDVQHITILPAFAPPYELLTEQVGSGVITFSLVKPSEKPTICSKDIAVVKIDFVETLTPEVGMIPFQHESPIVIVDSWIAVKDDQVSGYYSQLPGTVVPPNVVAIQLGLLEYSGDLPNIFIPKSIADLTLDATVDIADLAKVASKYGQVSDYANLVALPAGVNVDIFDIVFVAKRQGDP